MDDKDYHIKKFVYLDSDLDTVNWSDTKNRKHPTSMPIDSVISILPGMKTEVFAKWKTHRKPLSPITYNKDVAEKDTRCFSIVWTERTLDLEANDTKQRDTWIKALEIIINENKTVTNCRQQ